MAIEQLLILTIMVVFAIVHGLARWKSGIANSMKPSATASSEWDVDSRALDPFETAKKEPLKSVVTRTPRSSPRQRLANQAAESLPRAPIRPGTLSHQPKAVVHASYHTGLIPKDPAELRRAMALVAVLGPPRAIDPPR